MYILIFIIEKSDSSDTSNFKLSDFATSFVTFWLQICGSQKPWYRPCFLLCFLGGRNLDYNQNRYVYKKCHYSNTLFLLKKTLSISQNRISSFGFLCHEHVNTPLTPLLIELYYLLTMLLFRYFIWIWHEIISIIKKNCLRTFLNLI